MQIHLQLELFVAASLLKVQCVARGLIFLFLKVKVNILSKDQGSPTFFPPKDIFVKLNWMLFSSDAVF